jgi:hypothetical protein
MEKGGALVAEVSLINRFKTFKDVQVTKCLEEKIVTIYPQKKVEFDPYSWMILVDRLNRIGSAEALEWSKIVKDFCTRAQKAIELCVNGKDLIGENEKKIFEKVTARSNEKRQKIISSYPCIMLKTCLNRSGFGLTEISVNEKLLTEAGYSIETYSSAVLEEGLRQFMPFNEFLAVKAIKLLLRDCFDISSELCKPLEIDNYLVMKSGYVKKVNLQVHFLPTYHHESFEITRVIAIVEKGAPFLEGVTPSPALISPEYWENQVQKEHDLQYFLGNFYNKAPAMRYTNINKICRIRELKKNPRAAKLSKQKNRPQRAIKNGELEDEQE